MVDLPFGFEKPKDSPGFLLWQTTIVWQRKIKKVLEPYGVSHAQFVIMAILLWFGKHKFATTQSLIVNWSKLDKMTVSKSLKKLTTQGLVSRSEHMEDSRAKCVTLTKAGEILVCQLVPLVEVVDEGFFATASLENQQTLINILGCLAEHTD